MRKVAVDFSRTRVTRAAIGMRHSPQKIHGTRAELTTMARNDSTLSDEVAELQQLLAQTKAPGNVRDLTRLLTEKQQALADSAVDADVPMEDTAATAGTKDMQMPVASVPSPVKQPAAVHAVKSEVDDLNVYTEISRFGWEDEGTNRLIACCYHEDLLFVMRYANALLGTNDVRLRKRQGVGIRHVWHRRRR